MNKPTKYITLTVIAVFVWLFCGSVMIIGENETNKELFIKKYPTFQISFFDPYKSEPTGEEHEYTKRMDANGDWLPGTEELNEFLTYCKYRYGITGDDPIQVRSLCKTANSKK
ncbi:hypothetical protein [Glaciimonas soli]|uniref:Uncharacterized protein n=1 Tax=Glaciimonas soli TaxID=2590999 RepID=A0A843YY17_9BURK|nr:hypothetical protein [Glaciimonas soli]MQR02358.1 hypothetical protein [Glaciimonas soli]